MRRDLRVANGDICIATSEAESRLTLVIDRDTRNDWIHRVRAALISSWEIAIVQNSPKPFLAGRDDVNVINRRELGALSCDWHAKSISESSAWFLKNATTYISLLVRQQVAGVGAVGGDRVLGGCHSLSL